MNVKTAIVAASLIAAAAAIIYAKHLQSGNEELKNKVAVYDKTFSIQSKIVARHTDSAGQNHAITQVALPITAGQLKQYLAISPGGMDSTAMQLVKLMKDNNLKDKQIEGLQQVTFTSQAREQKAVAALDSQKRVTYYYKNKYLEITLRPGNTPGLVNDTASLDYKYNLNLYSVQYWKRSIPLIGSKHSYIDLFSDDPNVTINKLKRFTVEQVQPSFGLRGQVRSSYDFATGRIIPSAGLEMSFGKFDLSGRYYYSQQFDKLEPIISATYNFITIK